MQVYLDGEIYVLSPETQVQRQPIEEWPDNIRFDGQQKRKDRRFLSSWEIDSWQYGVGVKVANVATTGKLYRIWDIENVDSRFDGQLVLSPQLQTPGISPSRGDLDLHVEHLDQLYFCETLKAAGPIAFKFSPDTIGSFGFIGSCGNARIHGSLNAIKAFGADIWTLQRSTGTVHNTLVHFPTLGGYSTWTEEAKWMLGSTNLTRFGDILNFGGTLHIIDYIENSLEVWMQVNVPHASGTIPQIVATIGSNVGTYLSRLQTDGLTVFAHLPEGIYDVDITPSVVVSTERSKDKNCVQEMFENDLYFKNKKSVIKYDGVDVKGKGYERLDGLPSDKTGEVTAMASTWRWLFAAVKGATYSHILAMDTNNIWNYYARVPTPGLWVREMFLSDAPDAIDRLWLIYGNFGYPGYFMNPMVNPLNAGTYAHVPTGHVTFPRYDGGMADIPAGFYRYNLIGDSVTPTNNITAYYGLNDANPVTTLGVIGSINQSFIMGSPAGLEAYRIQPKFMLSTGSTAQSPVFRQAIIDYLKDPNVRETYQFEVDVEQTMRYKGRSKEDILGSLTNISNTRTLIPFYYGQIATKYVKVLASPSNEGVLDQKTYETERRAKVVIKLAEIL